MGSVHGSYKGIRVRIIVRLAETYEEECYRVEWEGREPGTQDMGENL